MPRDNVLQFHSGGSGRTPGGSGLTYKLYVVIFYLGLAAALALLMPLPVGIDLILILGLLYYFFDRRKVYRSARFRQYQWVWIILTVLIMLVYWQMAAIVLLFAVLYRLLVTRGVSEAPYFVRFHLMSALLLNILILLPLLIFNELLNLVGCLLSLGGLWGLAQPAFAFYGHWYPFILLALFGLPALWLSGAAVMGRTPYVPWVSGGARHWA